MKSHKLKNPPEHIADAVENPSPVEHPHKTLWETDGAYLYKGWLGKILGDRPSDFARVVFLSKEDAEAHAVRAHGGYWKWNGKPAYCTDIVVVMEEARAEGHCGVLILAFENGRWHDLAYYPANEPIPEELR